MSAPGPISDEAANADAILAILRAAIEPAGFKVLEPDAVEREDPRPEEYLQLIVERRHVAAVRAAGATGRSGWRVQTRGVSHTSRNNARRLLQLASEALEFAVLTVAGCASTPVKFESAESVGKDDGWWSGSIDWTYGL